MRFRQTPTASPLPAAVAISREQIELRILIEMAMEQAQAADTNAELIARQLADELNRIGAALSDVRVTVQDLYQSDRAGAEAYLSYLAKQGFPAKKEADELPKQQIARQSEQPAVFDYPPNACGQIAAAQTPDDPRSNEQLSASRLAFYSGNLVAELVANSAYSAIVLGERRSGTSAILRAILYDQIAKSGRTLLDILDLRNGQWGGLEDVKLPEGNRLVTYLTLSAQSDIDAIARKLSAVAAEVRRRQQQQRSQRLTLSPQPIEPYLFLIDGLGEIHGALPGWRADRCSKDSTFSLAASSLRVVLSHGPSVGISCVATARNHHSCLCDASALAETKLLFLGRVSAGRNGGYRAIDRAIEDKELVPSPHERNRYREVLSLLKQQAYPVVFTPSGIPRLGQLGDFSGYLSADLLSHYQQALEVTAG